MISAKIALPNLNLALARVSLLITPSNLFHGSQASSFLHKAELPTRADTTTEAAGLGT
jgi:hypothetical protein